MSIFKAFKIDKKRGILNAFELGDSISRILSYVQINFLIYGKIEIINVKENAENPIFLVLPETGKTAFSLYFYIRS